MGNPDQPAGEGQPTRQPQGQQAPVPTEQTPQQQQAPAEPRQPTDQGRQRPAREPEAQQQHAKGLKYGAAGGTGALGAAAITGLTGGSVVGTHESLMPIATAAAMAAGVALPPAFMVAFAFKEGTGKTTKLEKCAQEWEKAAKELKVAAQNLAQLVTDIPGEAWTMDDRPLYEREVKNFGEQVDALTSYFNAVSTSIMIAAWALLAYSVFAAAMGAYLFGLASVAGASLLSVVGAVAYGQCLALATIALKITWVAFGILAAAGAVAAGVMLVKMHTTAGDQEDNGAADVDAVLGKAWATGSAGAAANITEGLVNSGLNLVNKRGVLPTGQLDLDADRDIEKTWNVGIGGKVTSAAGILEGEGGYHAKVRDGAVQGQDVELKGKVGDSGGWGSGTVGGKLEWDENENLKNKSFMGGVESANTGMKAEYEGNFDEKNKYSDKYNVNTPVYNVSDGSFNKKADDETPPWDQNL
ncbi:hypothetical protein [Actinomadura sp. WMMB 499]|uniref:hypothetical protein n=1 Tax=Actinomadura sp. WMMB 499 TaxID=1219491 RepID=UPI001248AECA|nr:hypothetical protein [Actinomadura sp. WMMB 499]QFG20506.1 hypothetical protein F7P10_04340 [Actinomadura sp. WMMB 499]